MRSVDKFIRALKNSKESKDIRIVVDYDEIESILNACGRETRAARSPTCLIRPADEGALSRILSLATEYKTPCLYLEGWDLPLSAWRLKRPYFILDLAGLDGIEHLDETSHTAIVRAGTRLGFLKKYLYERGYSCGIYPPYAYPLSIGEHLCRRNLHPLSTRYGRIQDIVVGIGVVLPDGSVIRTRSVPRRAAGPDFNQLLIGQGVLTTFTHLNIRIYPTPELQRSITFRLPGPGEALEAAGDIIHSGIEPSLTLLYSRYLPRGKVQKSRSKEDMFISLLLEGETGEVEEDFIKKRVEKREGREVKGVDISGIINEKGEESIFSSVLGNEGFTPLIDLNCQWGDIKEIWSALNGVASGDIRLVFHRLYPESIGILIGYAGSGLSPTTPPPLGGRIKEGGIQNQNTLFNKVIDFSSQGKLAVVWDGEYGLKGRCKSPKKNRVRAIYKELKRRLDPANILNP